MLAPSRKILAADPELGLIRRLPPGPEGRDDDAREKMLSDHVEAATLAIERAQQSIDEIRKVLRFPLASSTRLEGGSERRRLD